MVSRQRRWQIKKAQAGLCPICGQAAVFSVYCLKHYIYQREHTRKKRGNVRVYANCKSRRLERGEK